MDGEDVVSPVKTAREHYRKQETKVQILRGRTKELEFLSTTLSDRLTLAQRKQFGLSNEKYVDDYTQLSLFNEIEQETDPDVLESEVGEIHPSPYRRKKRSDKKEEDLSIFKTTEVAECKLTGTDRNCSGYNTKYKVVTKETAKRLKFAPVRFEAAEKTTHIYSCPKRGAMKRSEKAPSLLKGSVATPSLVTGIMSIKYMGDMPPARRGREFAHYDLNLSTKTMMNWAIQCADRYLQPLCGLMKEEFLRSRYVHGDETRVQITDKSEQKSFTQNQMWVYPTDEYSDPPWMAPFQYERTRVGYHPVEFLGDQFQGYPTCGGYQAHHSLLEGVAVTGRMARVKRRFDKSMTVSKKDFTKEQLEETATYQTIARIGTFCKIEEMIRGKSPEERYKERQEQVEPFLEALSGWLRALEEAADRSSKIGETVLYTLNQETHLGRHLEDGRLGIDSLAAKRALEDSTIGRRNWLFAKSIRGTQADATVYNITGAALLGGLKLYNYLTYMMEKIKDLGAFPVKEETLELLL